MASFHESHLSGANIDFIEGLYRRYLEDPTQVDPSWREVFEKNPGGRPITGTPGAPAGGNGRAAPLPAAAEALGPAAMFALQPREGQGLSLADLALSQIMGLQSRVDRTVYAFRLRGHLLAQIDPLGRPRPALSHVADIGMVNRNHFSEQELQQYVDPSDVFPEKPVRLRDLMERLRRTYAHHIGVEFMNLLDSNRRRWLQPRMEHTENRLELTAEQQREILTQLSYAEGFESFLHTKYVGAKRFSLDGGESLVPMIHALLDEGASLGLKEVVIGMAHRGRLNVLCNILGKSPDQIFSEFEGPDDAHQYQNRGDVKYHQGFSSDYTTRAGHRVHLSLAFNPSHLEAVDPVVVGRVRAKEDRFDDPDGGKVIPLLIHGDAAFPGQGVVTETLNLSRLPAYDVGGTIHIVVNNQIGFTTDPPQTRSSIYCTAPALMLDIPVFHVNGDDPEACVHAVRLATQYRQQFKSDVVIDLVCYRRYGHNEADEPTFTQPRMYELIRAHPTVRQIYAEQLIKAGRLTQPEADEIRRSALQEFQAAHARVQAQSQLREPSAMEGLWKSFRGGPDRDIPQPETGVPSERLAGLLAALATVPEEFTPHPKIVTFLERRRAMARGEQPLDWSAGEALAFATLLADRYSVRLTGQDTERGTFSHRHAVLHDVKTGAEYVPLQHVARDQGTVQIHNSPLSELGCLGFEYGYSLDCPDCLVVWEAQFGDFVNGAQVIIDQFIVAAERKWSRLSGITLLLPHGYEGQGPEHSSARLERFLQLCAEDNIQVCYPTTPAQIFHLLRRQMIRPARKPLVVMSPKSLLRRPEAVSPLADLQQGRFQRVIPDRADLEPGQVEQVLLCSGKIFYDLQAERARRDERTVAIVRVEQLYPFPREEIARELERYPAARRLSWVQEEPRNMGAWQYISPLLEEMASARAAPSRLRFVGRVAAASPATGFHEAHELEQKLIVEEALSKEPKNG
jgi:2-oxoglutarate dehydrogenase E1 component